MQAEDAHSERARGHDGCDLRRRLRLSGSGGGLAVGALLFAHAAPAVNLHAAHAQLERVALRAAAAAATQHGARHVVHQQRHSRGRNRHAQALEGGEEDGEGRASARSGSGLCKRLERGARGGCSTWHGRIAARLCRGLCRGRGRCRLIVKGRGEARGCARIARAVCTCR